MSIRRGRVLSAALAVVAVASASCTATPRATDTSPTSAAPVRTALVARVPASGSYVSFAWAPDGRHILVNDVAGDEGRARVADMTGHVTATYNEGVGWLEASHVIAGDGHVSPIDRDDRSGPTSNSWAVANGHGAAAVIVAVPGCVGDPMIRWYRGGNLDAQETATPYGWSEDGRLALVGHFDCSDMDAEMHGWKGRVDVVDFAAGKVLGTANGVRGEIALNPSSTRLAAQSDGVLEIVDLATAAVRTIEGARLLAWYDDDTVSFLDGAGAVKLLDVPSGTQRPAAGQEWEIPSPAGPRLVVGASGDVRRLVSADGRTILLDLAAERLSVGDRRRPPSRVDTRLQPRWWSPDGHMLALVAGDAASVAIVAVEPVQ